MDAFETYYHNSPYNTGTTIYEYYGNRERLLLSSFCQHQGYTIDYLTDSSGFDHYEGIITNSDGEKILVEVKVRDCNTYDNGILLQEDKWFNLYELANYSDEYCTTAYYINVFMDGVYVIDINKINPYFYPKMLPKSKNDKTLISKRIKYEKAYITIRDKRLLNIYQVDPIYFITQK